MPCSSRPISHLNLFLIF
uniref:Uncharacterized protein n=1 Tax=Anguilla anguilla TaxID=7936 RepID=A0A0E9UY54_ANGAN